MTRPLLSIVVPTIGRPTLGQLLETIGGRPDVEVLLVADVHDLDPEGRTRLDSCQSRYRGPTYFWYEYDGGINVVGQPQRNRGMEMAIGEWLMFSQDDNVLEPDAINTIERSIATLERLPMLFRVQTWHGPVVWRERGRLATGNLDADCVVVPNDPSRLGKWGMRYLGDADFIIETAHHYGGRVHWIDRIIARGRPGAHRLVDQQRQAAEGAL